MFRFRSLVLLGLSGASLAWAEAPEAATKLVETKLVAPLHVRELKRSRLSRAPMAPAERRVRVEAPLVDPKGAEFLAFSIDVRHGWSEALGEWRKDATVGCVYVATSEVFVRVGDEVYPADILLGKRVKPAEKDVCRGASRTES